MRGRWADGIEPRNLIWVVKDRLAICERPGGYGTNHRAVRRTEEIIWIRRHEFDCIVSLLSGPHNLHAYDEREMPYLHLPLGDTADVAPTLAAFEEITPPRGGGGAPAAAPRACRRHPRRVPRRLLVVDGPLPRRAVGPARHRAACCAAPSASGAARPCWASPAPA